jgi:hypothetical protein
METNSPGLQRKSRFWLGNDLNFAPGYPPSSELAPERRIDDLRTGDGVHSSPGVLPLRGATPRRAVLQVFYARRDYPQRLPLIKYLHPDTGKHLAFLTNNFRLHP